MAIALALALAGVTADVLGHGLVRDFDGWLHTRVDAHLHGGVPRMVGTALSLVGQRGVVVVPLLIVAVLAARRHRSLRPVLVTVAVLLGVAVAVLALKAAIGRVAPSSGQDALHSGGQSYPSGHAIDAIVCWGLLLEFAASLSDGAERLLGRGRRRLITATLAFFAGAGMVALDYHWFSDVIAGWLLGGLVLTVVVAVGPVRRSVPALVSRSAPPR